MINAAVVGYGHWGPVLHKSFQAHPLIHVSWVCEKSHKRLVSALAIYPALKVTDDYMDVLNDKEVSLVVIATAVSTHYEIAVSALEARKHVFIEKPMTKNIEEAQSLITLSQKYGLKVFVDHIMVYSEGIAKVKGLIENGVLGDLYFLDFFRQNLGLYREDVNVLWDLASHDLAVLHYLTNETVDFVSCTGAARLDGINYDMAHLSIKYKNGLIANINVSWLYPLKVRRLIVAGSKQMLVYDDSQLGAAIALYGKGVQFINNEQKKGYEYRDSKSFMIELEGILPLTREIECIVDSILNNTAHIAGAHEGLEVVRLLEAAQFSLQNSGSPVFI
ncbi:MAG: Gfo/Idh/MocA family oxidoreductase [Candidatus Magnetoovum sp. WYHC-5]|nr:Gfo/Idh/MocA family oxidoreductase [Candidatus Magnetoovum sp. WYHC-5]